MATVFLRRGLATTAGTVAKAGAGAAPKKAAEGSVPTSAKTAASAKTTTVKKAAANKAKEEEEEGKEIIPKYWPTLMPQENLDALKESYMEHQLNPATSKYTSVQAKLDTSQLRRKYMIEIQEEKKKLLEMYKAREDPVEKKRLAQQVAIARRARVKKNRDEHYRKQEEIRVAKVTSKRENLLRYFANKKDEKTLKQAYLNNVALELKDVVTRANIDKYLDVIFEHPVSYNFGLQIQGKNLESNEAATIRKMQSDALDVPDDVDIFANLAQEDGDDVVGTDESEADEDEDDHDFFSRARTSPSQLKR